ncbi:MAG TPA: hypothetical protein VMC79_06540, partial [Rectinemataceae bacterium]|nr:hypothetical protein [Rectinemataceae bacterium]
LEGWDRRPYREAGLPTLLNEARQLRAATGAECLELYSFNFNTHADIYSLLFELNRIFRRVNLMSQRLDILAREEALLPAELAADKRSFTLGIEGISARMRRFYRKGLDDRDLEAMMKRLVVRGLRELKLFYIISGHERESDLEEFSRFVAALALRRQIEAAGLRILVSAGYLVRLPFTPLQFDALELREPQLAALSGKLQSLCEAQGIEFRLAVGFEDYYVDQLLALGGPALAPWLERVPERGFLFDGSVGAGCAESLRAFADQAGFFGGAFEAEKAEDWRPALGFIEPEAHHGILRAHYEAARECRDRALCLGGPCSDCGACVEPEDRVLLGSHAMERPASPAYRERLARLVSAKQQFRRVFVQVGLPPGLDGATAQYRSSWLLRALASGAPDSTRAIFLAEEALFSSARLEGLLPHFYGECVFSLGGPDPDLIRALLGKLGYRVLEELPEPSWIRADLRIAPEWARDAYPALRDWLAREHVEVIERREGGGRLLDVPERGRKRHLLYAVHEAPRSDGAPLQLRLDLGHRARLADWLDRLGPACTRSAGIRVLAFGASLPPADAGV